MAGANSSEAAAWHAKAIPMLERGVAIATAVERNFEDAQLRAGKPLPHRLSYQNVFAFMAIGYRTSGRYAEAVESYRHALAIVPDSPQYYTGIADTYAAMGDSGHAAVTLLEKGLALGLTPQALAEIGAAYAKAPGGACAVVTQGGLAGLNTDCPRVRGDMCQAVNELAALFHDARDEQRAADFRKRWEQSGCKVETGR